MKISKLLFFIMLYIPGVFFVSASPLSSLLNHPNEEYPLSDTVHWKGNSIPALKLLPSFPEADIIIKRFIAYHPEVTVERLYKLKLPPKYTGNTLETRRRLFTNIVNLLGHPESIVGYTYHSTTRDKNIVLFDKSYISNEKGKKLPGFDFTPETIPMELPYYQYIDEANFSGAVFKQKLVLGDNSLSYQSTNIQGIWFFIFQVMKAKGTRNEVLFFTDSKYLYIYNSTQVQKAPFRKILGFSVDLPSMFRKRMDVMTEWIDDYILKR